MNRERTSQDATNLLQSHSIPFSQNRLLQLMIIIYIVFWGYYAISPVDRTQWLIENILPVVIVIALALTYKKFTFSNSSYLWIFIFLCIHNYAAHFTYQQTPFDVWLKSAFHTQRSYFDRVVHFLFGFMWIYPVREILIRAAKLRGFWTYIIPVACVFSLSSTFEVIEMIAALLAGQAGETYVGLQGDPYDTQKDMGLALVGAIVSVGILAWIARRKRVKSKRCATR